MKHQATSERMAEAMEQARRHWQRARRQEGTPAAAAPPSSTPFTIAISREAGANGPAVARAAAKQLGWPVYDRELLQAIAAEMGLLSHLLESVDEKRQDWLRESLDAFSARRSVDEDAFVHQLVEVVLSLAAHGGCVIVGRGAAQILPAATTLRVRLVGPAEQRIDTICERFGISRREAAHWVQKTDAQRTRFVQDHFFNDPNDLASYDLVLNASRLSIMACADLIVQALASLTDRAPAERPEPVALS